MPRTGPPPLDLLSAPRTDEPDPPWAVRRPDTAAERYTLMDPLPTRVWLRGAAVIAMVMAIEASAELALSRNGTGGAGVVRAAALVAPVGLVLAVGPRIGLPRWSAPVACLMWGGLVPIWRLAVLPFAYWRPGPWQRERLRWRGVVLFALGTINLVASLGQAASVGF